MCRCLYHRISMIESENISRSSKSRVLAESQDMLKCLSSLIAPGSKSSHMKKDFIVWELDVRAGIGAFVGHEAAVGVAVHANFTDELRWTLFLC